MKILDITQKEEKRYKVKKGKDIHITRSLVNKDYLRRKIGVIKKESEIYLSSEKYGVKGIVDEVLTLENDTMSPLDYKYSIYKNKVYKTSIFIEKS